MKKKKILQIIGFIIIVVILAFALWWMFWREAPQVSPPDDETGTSGQLPDIGTGSPEVVTPDGETGLPGIGEVEVPEGLPDTRTPLTVEERERVTDTAQGGLTNAKRLLTNAVKGLKLSSDGKNVNFYNQDDNKFYRLTTSGDLRTLSDRRFFNVDKLTWSGSGNKAILEYPDGSNIIFDFQTGKQHSLPKQMTDFSFSSSDDQIGFKWLSEKGYSEDNWLGIASSDGSGINFIEPMGDNYNDVDVEWSPNSQIVATYRETEGLSQQNVYFIGQHGENFKYLRVYGRGFNGEWLPDGKHMLYDAYVDESGYRPQLWITRADGDNIGVANRSLGLATWVDKCTTAGSKVYCAVPEELPEGAGYVPEVANTIPDLIYEINTETGAKKLLAKPVNNQGSYSIEQMVVSEDGSTLYFTDRSNGELHSITLE